jgi:hypothetical protein
LWSIQQIEFNMPSAILVGTRLGMNTGKIDSHRFARGRESPHRHMPGTLQDHMVTEGARHPHIGKEKRRRQKRYRHRHGATRRKLHWMRLPRSIDDMQFLIHTFLSLVDER